MRTAIVSDLHLGSSIGEDLLRDPGIRAGLLEEIAGADRLVLLGDALELRELRLPEAIAPARSFFEDVGRAMAGREVLIVPGNHDHRLAEPLLETLAMTDGAALGSEHRGEPEERLGTTLAGWLGEARVEIAYPGVWLRDDVYATHGHYMDCHMSLPRIECLAAAIVMRAFGSVPDPATPADYEQVLRPIYGLAHGLAQSGLAQRATRPSEKAWKTISTREPRAGLLRRATIAAGVRAGIPAGVWATNRVLRTEFESTLTAGAIAASGIDAATELARRLRVDARHVITGHTHRAGPEEGEVWPLPGGGSLHNTGSWVFASAFHHPGTPPGPYWPGTVTWVEDEGPPRRVRPLNERGRDELKALVRRAATKSRAE